MEAQAAFFHGDARPDLCDQIVLEARRAECVVHPDVMDLYFQGTACRNRGPTPENLASAKRFFEKALALEPENVEALVGHAHVDAISAGSFVTDDRAGRFSVAETTLIKAARHDE